jgi:hypothetical protein
MYMHAQLKYIPGCYLGPNSTFFHTYLEKLSPKTLTLYRDLTIGDHHLSAKHMKTIVDLINLKLPNLLSLGFRALGRPTGHLSRIHVWSPLEASLRIIAAVRPISQLALRPAILMDPRAHLPPQVESFIDSLCIETPGHSRLVELLDVISSLMSIKDWRRESQDYHAIACQQGDYLHLTFSIRSTLAKATKMDVVEELDDIESRLDGHHEVLSRTEKHGSVRTELDKELRMMRI